MRTRQEVEKELNDCIVNKVNELRDITNMEISSVDVNFMRFRPIQSKCNQYFIESILITYE